MFDEGLQVLVSRHLGDSLEWDAAPPHVHDGGGPGDEQGKIRLKLIIFEAGN